MQRVLKVAWRAGLNENGITAWLCCLNHYVFASISCLCIRKAQGEMTYDCALRSHTHICTRRRNVVMIAGYYTSVKQRARAVQMIPRWHNTKSPDMHYIGVREVRSYFATGLHCSYRTKHFSFLSLLERTIWRSFSGACQRGHLLTNRSEQKT